MPLCSFAPSLEMQPGATRRHPRPRSSADRRGRSLAQSVPESRKAAMRDKGWVGEGSDNTTLPSAGAQPNRGPRRARFWRVGGGAGGATSKQFSYFFGNVCSLETLWLKTSAIVYHPAVPPDPKQYNTGNFNDYEKKFLRIIDEFGWHVTNVAPRADEEGHLWSYSGEMENGEPD
jgi:hypothetical protein